MGNKRKWKHLRYCLTFLSIILLFWALSPNPLLGAPASPTENPKTTSSFTDVDSADGNFVYIEYITKRGIIAGFPDGTFHPKEGLTRAQAAVVIAKAAGLETPAVDTTPFNDLEASHWAASSITAAARAGYIAGFPDGSFRADEQLTRAQGITLIMNLCTQSERAALPKLEDVSPDHWAAPAIATALALEMVGRSSDGSKVYPDAIMTRGSMARALSILLTRDPGLYSTPLNGTLCEIKGEVTITRSGKTWSVSQDTVIREGDTIQTGSNGQARITYPDGSGTMLEKNTQVTVKTAQGRNYIKKDGSPGNAVDYLKLDLQKGMLLGALATKAQPGAEETAGLHKNQVAALDSFNYLAANTASNQKWYQTAQSKKVKVEVDMPWGVAAIRGTFVMITINPDGSCRVSCLTGNAEVTGNSGNPVAIGGGQSTGISDEGGAASTASGMSEEDKQQFAQSNIQAWVVDTALQMDLNQEAQPVTVIVDIPDPQTGQIEEHPQPTQEELITTVVQTIVNALQSSGIELQPGVREDLVQQLQELNLLVPDIPSPSQSQNSNRNEGGSDSGGNQPSTPSALLSSLGVSAGALSPAFTPSVTSYSVTVNNAVSSISVTAAAASSSAQITVNEVPITSGSTSPAISLQEGSNTVIIRVTNGNAATTYTLTITRTVYGTIVSPADNAVVETLGLVTGTTDGQGDIVTGGGLFIKNNTLNKWIKPVYDPITGGYIGKTYVHNRSEACLLGPLTSNQPNSFSNWEIDLSGLELPNSYDYSMYLRVNLLNQGIMEDQDVAVFSTNILSDVDGEKSSVSVGVSGDNWVDITLRILDGENQVISGLSPDQFSAVIDGIPVSFAQPPFNGFGEDADYYVTLTGSSSSQEISSLKVGGVEIMTEPMTINFTGALTLAGTVKDASGNPLSGVEIIAALDYDHLINAAITNAQGQFSLTVPPSSGYRIKYELPGYSAPYQFIDEGSPIGVMDVVMQPDNIPPSTIIKFLNQEGDVTLRAVDNSLADESWLYIYNLIQANTNGGENWCSGVICEMYVNPEGTEMKVYADGELTVNQDFVIPAYLINDRACNRAAAPIIVNKDYFGWLPVGTAADISDGPAGALSLVIKDGAPVVAIRDESTGNVLVKKYDNIEKTWAELGNPSYTGSETGLALNLWGQLSLAYIDEDAKVNLSIWDTVYNTWNQWPTTGNQAEKLQYSANNDQVAIFADTVSGYVYGAAQVYNGEWCPLVECEGDECYFYQGAEPIQDLATTSSEDYYVAYISSDQLNVVRSSYQFWETIGTPSDYGGIIPAGGVSPGIYQAMPLVAYVDNNGIQVKQLQYPEGSPTWINLGSPGVNETQGPISLYVYRSIPYLCFTDGEGHLRMMKYGGGEWQIMDSLMPAPLADSNELEITVDNGRPYVFYRGSDGKANMIMYMSHGSNNVNITSLNNEVVDLENSQVLVMNYSQVTTAGELLNYIQAEDGSRQTYRLFNSDGCEIPLTSVVTDAVLLEVLAEDGITLLEYEIPHY